ncbi:MAG: hypothetical protein DWQ01_02290 [Planctomycetota bacterium]|nr:MAG: hypothetical protein DWQ01_02290 [Planctomycetota bacterium]
MSGSHGFHPVGFPSGEPISTAITMRLSRSLLILLPVLALSGVPLLISPGQQKSYHKAAGVGNVPSQTAATLPATEPPQADPSDGSIDYAEAALPTLEADEEQSLAKKKKSRKKKGKKKRKSSKNPKPAPEPSGSSGGNNNSGSGSPGNAGAQPIPPGTEPGLVPEESIQIIPHWRGTANRTEEDVLGPFARASSGEAFELHLDQLSAAPGSRLKGTCQWGSVQRAMQAFADISGPNALYRIKMYTAKPNPASDPARHTRLAQEVGFQVLLTVKGTPLSMASDKTKEDNLGDEYPPFARSMPVNLQDYADYVVDLLGQFEKREGVLPDFVEIWAEPDRPESWSGTRDDYIHLYEVVSKSIRASFPQIKLGGAGVAGVLSDMGGERPMLLSLIDFVVDQELPMDFVSWHHYTIGAELRYNGAVQGLRDHLEENGLDEVRLFVSEWNIYPSAINNPDALSFENSHAAANFVSFFTAAADLDLDGNVFFQLQDIDGQQSGIHDLHARSVGSLSWRGVKKPVFRIMEVLFDMAEEQRVQVDHPELEFGAAVFASLEEDRLRIVVGNDVVPADWVWSQGIREYGLKPGLVWKKLLKAGYRVGGPLPNQRRMSRAGMSEQEIEAAEEVMPRVEEARILEKHPRQLQLSLQGLNNFNLERVWRFDSQNNDPVNHRLDIQATLVSIEEMAQDLAGLAVEEEMQARGIAGSAQDFHEARNPMELSQRLGVSESVAVNLFNLFHTTLAEERLSEMDLLDTLQGLSLQSMTAEQAEIQINKPVISFEIEPNGVAVLELRVLSE